jgi:hypothetical protein
MARRSTSNLEWLLLGLLTAPAAQAGDDALGAFKDIGAVLGWRLAPETLEQHCRAIDPDGADVRAAALRAWLAKNGARIAQVDGRVAEVIPLLMRNESADDAQRIVREQVRKLLLEALKPETCRALRDPQSSAWTSNGMPHVAESLAALYDWQVSHTPH